MEQDLNEKQIDHVLSHNVIGHLGCHAENVTYIVPICYAYHEDYIYGRTYEGQKVQMLRKNSKVCFQVENIESMVRWKSVICWGEFEELTDSEKRNQAIEVLRNRINAVVMSQELLASQYWPFQSPEKKGIVFAIRISRKTGRSSFA